MGPLLSGKPFPLDLGHASTAEYQRAEFIDESIMLVRDGLSKELIQFLEKFPLAVFLALQSETNQRGDRFAHACVNCLGVALNLIRKIGDQSNGIPGFDFARMTPPGFLISAALNCRLSVGHISSVCLTPMHSDKPHVREAGTESPLGFRRNGGFLNGAVSRLSGAGRDDKTGKLKRAPPMLVRVQ